MTPLVGGWRFGLAKARFWAHALRLALGRPRGAAALLGLVGSLARARGGRSLRRAALLRGRWFWDLHAPGFPGEACDRFLRTELDGAAGGPSLAILAVTRACPNRCSHCFEADALDGEPGFSVDELASVVRQLQEAGAAQIFFTGGEPLTRGGDLVALLRGAGPGTDFWILSSGAGMTPELALDLRRAGLVGLVLSLDHWDPARNDAFRGPGAHGTVAEAARSAHAAGLLVALGLCPTRAFLAGGHLEPYLRAARDLGAAFVAVTEPQARGRYAGEAPRLDGPARAVLEEAYGRVNFGTDDPGLPVISDPARHAREAGCPGAARRYLYVDPRGGIRACPFCDEVSGRVQDGDLAAVVARLRREGCPAAPCPAGLSASPAEAP